MTHADLTPDALARLRAELAGARADERERCALVAEEMAVRYVPREITKYHAVDAVAAAIRSLPAAAVLARGGSDD